MSSLQKPVVAPKKVVASWKELEVNYVSCIFCTENLTENLTYSVLGSDYNVFRERLWVSHRHKSSGLFYGTAYSVPFKSFFYVNVKLLGVRVSGRHCMPCSRARLQLFLGRDYGFWGVTTVFYGAITVACEKQFFFRGTYKNISFRTLWAVRWKKNYIQLATNRASWLGVQN